MHYVTLALMSLLLSPIVASGTALPDDSGLKVEITIEQQVLSAPFAAQVTLHLHNSGNKALWLYRPVTKSTPGSGHRDSETGSDASGRASPAEEGPTLAVHLEGVENGATALGQGEVLDTVGMPHPKLIRLAPGEDEEEKTEIRLLPAQIGTRDEMRAVWGRYKFTVTCAAKYSNAEELDRILGVTVWQGEMESNSVVLDLQPPAATDIGGITGTVVNPANSPLDGILVSLSNREERLLNQATTDLQGKFSFAQLPPAFYWVTIRRRDATEDTAIFRHLVLTPAEPAGTVDFVLTPPETSESKQVLHKPVLIQVVDGSGAPLANVGIASTWSNGTVLDSVKGVTGSDGIALLELIPGANYLTLKRHGCPKDDEKIIVMDGPGIDGSRMVLDCSKK